MEMKRLNLVPVTRSDMHRWLAAFPSPTNPDREDDEVIYEDWGEEESRMQTNSLFDMDGWRLTVTRVCVCVSDCPQVQCVEQYVAQQADELTLEPTEIINVLRKTNEGKNFKKVSSIRT